MYCAYCGAQFLENDKYCPACGNPPKSDNKNTHNPDPSKPLDKEEVERQMLIAHLLDLRTLEFARNNIYKKMQDIANRIKGLCIQANIVSTAKKNLVISIILGFIIFVFSSLILSELSLAFLQKRVYVAQDSYTGESIYMNEIPDSNRPLAFSFIAGSLTISFIFAFYPYYFNKKRFKKQKSDYENRLETEKKRLAEEEREREDLQKDLTKKNNEYKRITDVLSRTYAVNIIPLQFRNIYGIHYLYDYLSTSRETLQSALMNFNLNEIKMRLDNVIANQEDMISLQYIHSAKLDMLANQNKHLINLAQSIDNSAQNASRYAGIAAANTEAIAYFKLSEYFRET